MDEAFSPRIRIQLACVEIERCCALPRRRAPPENDVNSPGIGKLIRCGDRKVVKAVSVEVSSAVDGETELRASRSAEKLDRARAPCGDLLVGQSDFAPANNRPQNRQKESNTHSKIREKEMSDVEETLRQLEERRKERQRKLQEQQEQLRRVCLTLFLKF